MLVDGRGVPLSLVVTGANRHDVSQVEAVLDAIVIERANPPLRRNKHLCAGAGLKDVVNNALTLNLASSSQIMRMESANCGF